MPHKTAITDHLLRQDVAAMMEEESIGTEAERLDLAKDIITVVRERVLREITRYARENVK